jgi:hypothetical protein
LGSKTQWRAKKILQEDILILKHNLFGHFPPKKTFDGHFSESLGGQKNACGLRDMATRERI